MRVLMMMIINGDDTDDVFKVFYFSRSVEPQGVLVVKLGQRCSAADLVLRHS